MMGPHLPLGGQQRSALSVAYGRIVWREIRVHELQLSPVGARTAVDPICLDVFQLFPRIDVYLFVVEKNVLLEALSKFLVKNSKRDSKREQGENREETERWADRDGKEWDRMFL